MSDKLEVIADFIAYEAEEYHIEFRAYEDFSGNFVAVMKGRLEGEFLIPASGVEIEIADDYDVEEKGKAEVALAICELVIQELETNPAALLKLVRNTGIKLIELLT